MRVEPLCPLKLVPVQVKQPARIERGADGRVYGARPSIRKDEHDALNVVKFGHWLPLFSEPVAEYAVFAAVNQHSNSGMFLLLFESNGREIP